MLTATELFSQALMLEPGDRVIAPCTNYYEMETLRVSLYRQLNKLRKVNPTQANNLWISREVNRKDNKYIIYITHSPPVKDAFIQRADGTIQELAIPKGAEDAELNRICKLMKEDGHSEEEIEEYRRAYTSCTEDIG